MKIEDLVKGEWYAFYTDLGIVVFKHAFITGPRTVKMTMAYAGGVVQMNVENVILENEDSLRLASVNERMVVRDKLSEMEITPQGEETEAGKTFRTERAALRLECIKEAVKVFEPNSGKDIAEIAQEMFDFISEEEPIASVKEPKDIITGGVKDCKEALKEESVPQVGDQILIKDNLESELLRIGFVANALTHFVEKYKGSTHTVLGVQTFPNFAMEDRTSFDKETFVIIGEGPDGEIPLACCEVVGFTMESKKSCEKIPAKASDAAPHSNVPIHE